MEDTKRLTSKHNDVKLSIIERLVPVSNACPETALFVQSEPQQNLTLLLITTDRRAVVIIRTVLLRCTQLKKEFIKLYKIKLLIMFQSKRKGRVNAGSGRSES